jgi:glutamate-1-semialdehyde 2,1-aminomutase
MEKHSVEKSMALYRRAKDLLPGVSQLISRRPSRAALGVSPIYAERAEGCRIWDIDGNEYVDWFSGVGPIILGYADPVVDQAVRRQMEKGSVYSILHPSSVQLAEELVRLVPAAEMVRFTKGGGEACTVAVRIARGYTGRDKVLFCGYHGWHDWYLAANLGGERLDGHLLPDIDPVGVPQALEGSTIPFPYGDLPALEALLAEHGAEVACVIMEPMRTQEPPAGYLAAVRDLAHRYGILLVFDEVSSGFRVALGGAQEYLGVTPDMAVFAKAISNGYPMGAVVGHRDVMSASESMFISSAYWDDNIGAAAALATLAELERRQAPAFFADLGRRFIDGFNRIAAQTGAKAVCSGSLAHPGISFDLGDHSAAASALFLQENARQGLILATGFFFNMAHDEEALEYTLERVGHSLSEVGRGLERGDLEEQLETPLEAAPFRRLVR